MIVPSLNTDERLFLSVPVVLAVVVVVVVVVVVAVVFLLTSK